MSRIPLTDRPHALLVDATICMGDFVITAPLAVVILASAEHDERRSAPAAAEDVEPTQGPGLASCRPRHALRVVRSA
jgi:hypothetical protein